MRIILKDVSFGFDGKKLFDHFNLVLTDEAPLVILGASGCGKTTLLRLIAGLLPPDSGSISFLYDDGTQAEQKASCMFQESRLLPWLSILENVMLPLVKSAGLAAARERALSFLRLTAIENKASAFPAALSGGECRRASMARAFAYDAPLLLLDEPFQSLDIPLRIALMETLSSLLKNDRRAALIITHDPREALFLGRRILVLKRREGAAQVVLDEPNEASRNVENSSGIARYLNPPARAQEERFIAALS